MVRTLLVRGMLAGLIAGLLAFGMAKGFSEPSIDRAIAFETQEHEAKKAAAHEAMSKMPMAQDDVNGGKSQGNMAGMAGMAGMADDDDVELVSRPVQSGIGLFTGVMVYSIGIGGLFALVYAYAQGRTGRIRPRTLSLLLAAAGLVAVIVVPQLKYPANPPSVGEPETIVYRTKLYFAMIAISVAAMCVGVTVMRRTMARYGLWNAGMIGAAAFIAIVAVAQIVLPDINEVPEGFPASVLWHFRVSSLGIHLVLWTALGLIFGALTERQLKAR